MDNQKASQTHISSLFHELGTNETGLSSEEALKRLSIFGLNEFKIKGVESLWKKYLEQFMNPFILLLLGSAVISLLMGQFDDAISISCAILIVVLVGFIQEARSEKTLERLGAMLPPKANVYRDSTLVSIYAKYLVPGDIIALSLGDRVPADVRLFEVYELMIDESSFTGETELVTKNSESSSSQSGDLRNICFMGTLVGNGKGRGVVVNIGEQSQFGEVYKMMATEVSPRAPLQENMDKLGKQLSIYSLSLIGLLIIVGVLNGQPILEMFNVGVSLAVAAIPEGLPIVVTVTLALGVMRMANHHAIVKRLPTVETLGCLNFICSDKTGTLTTNKMTVYKALPLFSLLHFERSNNDDDDNETKNEKEGNDYLFLLKLSVLCNNAELESKVNSGIEKALLLHAHKFGVSGLRSSYSRVSEVPFTSERKYMTVLCRNLNSNETLLIHKGALETILEKLTQPLSEDVTRRVTESHDALGSRGLRLIAFASQRNDGETEFNGVFALHDPPRPLVKDSIQKLKSSGIQIAMITGDGLSTAESIARTLDIHQNGRLLLSGLQLDSLSDEEFLSLVENVSVYYRASPRQKLRIVKALQSLGHCVGMTGDGVNDGVAVKKADVGISMGISGTDVCKEAADMILLDDDFSTIVRAVEEGKCIFYNIRNFVRFQLSTSIAALILVSLSTLLRLPNPLNPMQILWINVIMDGPPAQSLGLEPLDHSVLKLPPRDKKEPILSKSLIGNVLFSATIIILGTLWIFKMMMEDGKITARDTTMTFTSFVFFDMFNALACRSQDRLITEVGFTTNRVFLYAVTMSLVGQLLVIYFPPLQYIFQTESLQFQDLLLLLLLSSSVFILSEIKKLVERKMSRRRSRKNSKPKTQKDYYMNI